MQNKTLTELDHKHIWHPFTQMQEWQKDEPLFIEKGEGNYLIDINGNRYLDAVSSLWCNVHGHCKKELNDAIIKQVNNIAHSTMLGLSNIPATLLGKELVDITPPKLNKVFYSDSGSTAVEIALKIAYQYFGQTGQPKKKKFIKLQNAYHGDTIGSVSLGGIKLFHTIFSSLLFETFEIPTPSLYHSVFKDEKECDEHSLNALKSILEKHHSSIAALVIEPFVQGAAGILMLSRYFMEKLALMLREYDVLFIADEIATGFARTGRMFACEEGSLEPDIMTIGKGLTGGYLALAATLVTDEIYNGFLGNYNEEKAFYHGHTYTGNPIAASCALASLELFKKEAIIETLPDKIAHLQNALLEFYNLDCVGDIRIKGLMAGIELTLDTKQPEPIGHKVCMEIRKHGVIMRPLGNTLVLMPPLSITIDEIDFMTKALYKAITAIIK